LSHKQLSPSTSQTDPSKPPSKRLKIHSEHELKNDRNESHSASTFVLGETTTTTTTTTKIEPSASLKSSSHLTLIPPTPRGSSTKKRIVKLRDAVLARTSKINCSLRRTISASFGLAAPQRRPSFCDIASSQSTSLVVNCSNSSTQEKNSIQDEKTPRSLSVRTTKYTTKKLNPQQQNQNQNSPVSVATLSSQEITQMRTHVSPQNVHSGRVSPIKTTQNCDRKYVISFDLRNNFLQSQHRNVIFSHF
jgi:hypothetical protein